MIKNGTVNKTAYAKLPPVSQPAKYPTLAQVTAAGSVVAQVGVVPQSDESSRGPAAPRRRGIRRFAPASRGAWVGILPFALYVLLFLGLPLYEVIHGAITTNGGSSRWSTSATFHSPAYTSAFMNSLILSLWTSLLGGVFGLWLAAAVVAGRRSLLRRIVGSGSAVLAYFAGVPLAFAFIATLGAAGVVTILLQHIGINLNTPASRSPR